MNNNDNDNGGGGAALIHILLDIGPACTTNASTLREALHLVTQELPSSPPSSSSVENNNAWKEVGVVARLLHFFAAVVSNNDDAVCSKNNLSCAFINVDFNSKGQTQTNNSGDCDWNLEVISHHQTSMMV